MKNNFKNKLLDISHFSFLISHLQKGQALITLLFFVLISLTITSGAIIIIIANSISASKLQEGTSAYYTAESGVENALLRLLRDPNYAGETLTVGTGTAVITVTGANPKTVVSVGQNGNFKRTVQAQMNYSNGYYTFSNWKEL
ncbi:MAG: hypothetical protein HYW62_03285 [Candidatus Levybacteria bacterium]|nr:hypothetical protein [Candidatus Levybacteria bacterium]